MVISLDMGGGGRNQIHSVGILLVDSTFMPRICVH